MCSDSYSEFHRLVQQCILTTEVGKLKCESLNELFAALSRSGIKDKKSDNLLRSVLRATSRGNKIGYSTLNEVYKYLKNLRKPNNGANPLREICDNLNQKNVQHNVIQPTVHIDKSNFEYTYRLRSSHRLHNNFPISTSDYDASEKLASVQESEIFKSQENPSQFGFLEYFGLGPSDSLHSPKIINKSPSFSMSMFNNSANVPFSSELGLLLAERVNHSVSDDFKLRKLERLERYINKPHIEKNENVIYPVTYVEKNSNTSFIKKVPKTMNPVCKSLSVVLENVDLIKLKKQMYSRARKRTRDRRYRLKKKCKELRVLLRPSDRKNIETLLKKRK